MTTHLKTIGLFILVCFFIYISLFYAELCLKAFPFLCGIVLYLTLYKIIKIIEE
jgi:hypothetical protein